ncbi:MAG: hypothetical protein QOH04_1643 [Sphingomonadales bacterium]|jgi:hypothetical protein|nr:hypothetical protein [Sphingomonadales bacterium]
MTHTEATALALESAAALDAIAATTDPSVIINLLKEEARQQLGPVFGSAQLEAFQVTGQGQFYYNWQDSVNIDRFNKQTYNWISSNVKAGGAPIMLDQSFNNLYLQVIQSIYYGLSSADQSVLNNASANSVQQAGAVQRAWKSAFGSLPAASANQTPIQAIAAQIVTWASPTTTLQAIRKSTNINNLLNNVPAGADAVVPVFVNYLNALGPAVSLQDTLNANANYLQAAVNAIKSPSTGNGGLTLNDGSVVPAYQVTTQVSDILNSLKSGTPQVSVEMTVSRSTEDEFRVSVSGSTGFSIPILDFLTIGVSGEASYFSDNLATTSNETSVSMTFPGVNYVTFQPVAMTLSGNTSSWFWVDPIRQAIANTGKDVSSFKFAPLPNVDFTAVGAFGYLQGVVISSYPTITITTKTSNYQKVQKTFEQSSSVSVSFLGIPLGSSSESTYSNHVTVDASSSTVTITLSPPPNLVAGTQNDSQAWVLGVVPNYPAA